MEKIDELQNCVESLSKDVHKFFKKNNKAAGVRARKKLQKCKRLSQEIRMKIQKTKQEKVQEKATETSIFAAEKGGNNLTRKIDHREERFFQVQDNSDLAPLESTLFPPLECRTELRPNVNKTLQVGKEKLKISPVAFSLASKGEIYNWGRSEFLDVRYSPYTEASSEVNTMHRRMEEIPRLHLHHQQAFEGVPNVPYTGASSEVNTMHRRMEEIPRLHLHHQQAFEGVPDLNPFYENEETEL